MRKKILGAITFMAAVGGVIYMKNNPKYKEIVRIVRTADARGFYEKIILEKDKLAFTTKAKIKDYKIDYESIRSVGEKIYARLIVNNDEKLNIDTVLDEKDVNVEEVAYSEKLDDLLKIAVKGVNPKDLNFNKVYIRTHRRSSFLISKFAL